MTCVWKTCIIICDTHTSIDDLTTTCMLKTFINKQLPIKSDVRDCGGSCDGWAIMIYERLEKDLQTMTVNDILHPFMLTTLVITNWCQMHGSPHLVILA